MVTMETNPSAPSSGLKLDSITHIDISTLSQSELHALCLCSPSAFDLSRTHDLVVPKIDRSLFNESAGSRRQTYSRPRKPRFSSSPSTASSAAAATGHRRRVAGLLPTRKLPPSHPDDPERIENRAIINFLKKYIADDPKFDGIELNSPTSDLSPAFPSASHDLSPGIGGFLGLGGERKRKRGRKPKVQANLEEGLQIVNKNGAAVDLIALGNADESFAEELRRRTAGLESEEELLGFMRDLGGQWGSRRKKRKIVDATVFGDLLPIGWKLLLGLKRKDGRAWIYCRRYISPTGQQFISCKETSAYLQTLLGSDNAQRPSTQKSDSVQQDSRLTSENESLRNMQHPSYLGHTDENQIQSVISSSNFPSLSVSNDSGKEVALLEIENLAEVQIHDLFECHKCSMSFEEKDSYLQHLLSFHQKTTRRYRLGSSVGDGVIIKDGKYECQFCHKVFLERHRYNGHVGIHVRNYVRKVEELPGQVSHQKTIDSEMMDGGLPSRISKMDALIEIAQNSILETSACGPNDELNTGSGPEFQLDNSDFEVNSDSPVRDHDMEDSLNDGTLSQQDFEHRFTGGNTDKFDDPNEVITVEVDSCLDKTTHIPGNEQGSNNSLELLREKDGMEVSAVEIHKTDIQEEGVSEGRLLAPSCNSSALENVTKLAGTCNLELAGHDLVKQNYSELNFDFVGSGKDAVGENVKDSQSQTSEGFLIRSGVLNSSMPIGTPLDCFPIYNSIPEKAEEELLSIDDQRRGNVTGFDELRFEEIETLKYNFTTAQESLPLPDVPMDLTNNSDVEGAFGSSGKFEPEVILNLADGHNQLTVCVWCEIQFSHAAADSEIQSDSVGFMCPTCKAKISGQFNVLEGGSPMNS